MYDLIAETENQRLFGLNEVEGRREKEEEYVKKKIDDGAPTSSQVQLAASLSQQPTLSQAQTKSSSKQLNIHAPEWTPSWAAK